MPDTLSITEIYKSVQGESSFAGLPCTFIRLAGCPLRCRWCDTVYSFKAGDQRLVDDIVTEVNHLGVEIVEVTGGEPMAQAKTPLLLQQLAVAGHKVLMETSGSESLESVPDSTHIIMDLKCPGSGMEDRNHWDNLKILKATDEIKFVVADRADFDWALTQIDRYNLCDRFPVLMSPAFGQLKPDQLVAWMLEYPLPYRLNLQIHKYIWSPRAKGV